MMDNGSEALSNLIDALGIEDFTLQRDFGRERGWDPSPTEAQVRAIEKLSGKLQKRVSNKIKKDHKKNPHGEDAEEEVSFDVNAKKRVILFEGKVLKRSTASMIQHSTKRHAVLLNDVLLITSQESGGDWLMGSEKLVLHQAIPLDEIGVLDLRLVDPDEDQTAFEIITRDRNYLLCAETPSDKNIWLEELESAIFALKSGQTPKKVGWQHEIIRGTLCSAAAYGELDLLRRHMANKAADVIDETDESGMNALHWAAAFGNLECVELLLDAGCEIDCLNGGLNSPLLIAAAMGRAEVCYRLINKGADIQLRNLKDLDCMLMALLFGGYSEDLHDLVLLLKRRGIDINTPDASGACPLHACSVRSVPRPIQILVDCGANINAKHSRTGLTPLQMACSAARPDAETVRSMLEKGAHPNWRDATKRSAFDMVIGHTRRKSVMTNKDLLSGGNSPNFDQTVDDVSEFVQVGLPVLMELVKKGCRFTPEAIRLLRQSFQEVLLTARQAWETLSEPDDFEEYISACAADANMASSKDKWIGDNASLHCLLCAEKFTMSNRRHHCRACGVLCCDECSSKRLHMKVSSSYAESSNNSRKTTSGDGRMPRSNSSKSISPPPRASTGDRVCDGCFNRLVFECFQWVQADKQAKKVEAKAAAVASAEYNAFLQSEKGKLLGTAADGSNNNSNSSSSSGTGKVVNSKNGSLNAGRGGTSAALSIGADTRLALEERGEKLDILAAKSEELNQGAAAFKQATARILAQQRQRAWL